MPNPDSTRDYGPMSISNGKQACRRVVEEFGAIEGGKQTLEKLRERLEKMWTRGLVAYR